MKDKRRNRCQPRHSSLVIASGLSTPVSQAEAMRNLSLRMMLVNNKVNGPNLAYCSGFEALLQGRPV